METTEATIEVTTDAIEIAASAPGEGDKNASSVYAGGGVGVSAAGDAGAGAGAHMYEGADGDALAESLAEVAPTAGLLDRLACERLSATGRLDAVVAWERSVRHAQAGLTHALGALARLEGEEGWRIEDEVGAALAWAPSTAQNRLIEAEVLTRLFPATVRLLGEGRISMQQARSLEQLTGGLEDAAAQAVEARVLVRMAGQSASLTCQAIRRAVVRADPDAAAKRHRRERERRRVELIPEGCSSG